MVVKDDFHVVLVGVVLVGVVLVGMILPQWRKKLSPAEWAMVRPRPVW